MQLTPFRRDNIAEGSTKMKGTVPLRNAGLRWAMIGGVVMGFLGAMKITGNLNRQFFAELIMMFPSKGKTLETEANKNPLQPGMEATVVVKSVK